MLINYSQLESMYGEVRKQRDAMKVEADELVRKNQKLERENAELRARLDYLERQLVVKGGG